MRFIDRDPMEITINRRSQVQDPSTGGRTPVTTTLGPIVCRLAQMRVDVAVAGAQVQTEGQFTYSNRYALICPFMDKNGVVVDLKAGGQVRDNIDLPGYGSFYVKEINRETTESGIYGYVAHLELRT